MRFWNASWISPALTIVLAGLLIGAPLLVLNGFR